MEKFSSFPDVPTFQAEQAAEEGLRKFVATGGPVLSVPGLKKLTRVRVGVTELPLKQTISVLDGASENMPQKMVEVELVQLAKVGGEPVLRRSHLSNDGVWQAGAEIFIGGDWEPEAPPVIAAATADETPTAPALTVAEKKAKAEAEAKAKAEAEAKAKADAEAAAKAAADASGAQS